jgi:tetratricopeptide (TPR) repeat protein
LNVLGESDSGLEQTQHAAAHFAEALALATAIEYQGGQADAHIRLGCIDHDAGAHLKAKHHFSRAAALYKGLNRPSEAGYALRDLGNSALALKELDLAEGSYAEAVALGDRTHHTVQGYSLLGLGLVAKAREDMDAARRHLADARVAFSTHGDAAGEADVLSELGDLEVAAGQPERAKHAYTEASQLYTRGGRTDLAERVLAEVRKREPPPPKPVRKPRGRAAQATLPGPG